MGFSIWHRLVVGFLAFLLLAICSSTGVRNFYSLPFKEKVYVGEPLPLNLTFPNRLLEKVVIYVKAKDGGVLQVGSNKLKQINFIPGRLSPVASTPGSFLVELKLFGIIPLRQMVVNAFPQIMVIPGGQSIGILLHSQGVIVVGHSAVQSINGLKKNPAAEAGIMIGDVITKIDQEAIKSDEQVRDRIDQDGITGRKAELEIKRGNLKFQVKVKPIFCQETKRYRIGLYVKDTAAGVGTLTFYEPESKIFGALGHIIADVDAGRQIDLADGYIVEAIIQGIHPGKRGEPGEKIGFFQGEGKTLGRILLNTQFGIFGTIETSLNNPFFKTPVPIALSNQIHAGPAEIITVLNGVRMERFKIKIVQISPQAKVNGKGLIIKITDKRLLFQTGGIIQGMSGSPILQDGKFIGAVTHVFVNDPSRGYGVPAEWMLKEVSPLIQPQEDKIRRVG